MLICNDCGAVFDAPVEINDPETGREDQCPACRSTDFERAARCACCRGVSAADKLHSGLCEECVLDAATPGMVEQYAFDRGIQVEFYSACFGSDILYCGVELFRVMIAAFHNGRNRAAFCRGWVRNTTDTLDDFAAWLAEYREGSRCSATTA